MANPIMVSLDSHATMPPEVWATYLDRRYHDALPSLREENEIYTRSLGVINTLLRSSPDARAVYDTDGAYAGGGYRGLWDARVRIDEMDREGIAAEVVYCGDMRVQDMFHSITNRTYPLDLCDAGVRAYHRWAHDTFGNEHGRLKLVGVIGPAHDMDATLAELHWIADHGFVGTYVPGFVAYPGARPLDDGYWEPFWSACEQLGLVLVVHGGYGKRQGALFPQVEALDAEMKAGSTLSDEEVAAKLASTVFTTDYFEYVECRQPMWQLMFGGVFDRHPDLRLLLTEVRGDWIPATLDYLDEIYALNRTRLAARRTPREYWEANILVCLSFVHRSEVPMRHDIGLGTMAFGRDYPHAESMWPNTRAWLRDAFSGVPEGEFRRVLGENAVDFLQLDRMALAGVAERIGPSMAELTSGPAIDPALVAHFDARSGYLKAAEGDALLGAVDSLLQRDLARAGRPT